MASKAEQNFQLRMAQCTQLLASADNYVKQEQFDQAIEEYTKIIMFAPNWYEEADKSGVPSELREVFIIAMQTAYNGCAVSYRCIGEIGKSEAYEKMLKESLSGKYSPPSKNEDERPMWVKELSSGKSSLKKSVSDADDGDSWIYWIICIIGFLAWKFFFT